MAGLSLEEQAVEYTGIPDPQRQYFVDDSRTNIDGARNAGWKNLIEYAENATGYNAEEGRIGNLEGTTS